MYGRAGLRKGGRYDKIERFVWIILQDFQAIAVANLVLKSAHDTKYPIQVICRFHSECRRNFLSQMASLIVMYGCAKRKNSNRKVFHAYHSKVINPPSPRLCRGKAPSVLNLRNPR
jgi:hypothetical protein